MKYDSTGRQVIGADWNALQDIPAMVSALGNSSPGGAGAKLWCDSGSGAWVNISALEANPTASVGLATINGSALTFMRSDAAPALDVTISPTWTGIHIFDVTSSTAPITVTANSTANPGVIRIENLTNGTGSGAYALLEMFNGTHYLAYGISSTGLVGGWTGTTGGPSGESARISTTGNVPLWFGVNLTEVMRLTSTGVTVDAPASSGSALSVAAYATGKPALVVSGITSTDAHSEFSAQRAGSTANNFGQGPGIQLLDTTNNKQAIIQVSGGQLEFWLYDGATFSQVLGITAPPTTGAKTASFTASNKPGTTNATTPIAWMPVVYAGGIVGYMPIFAP